MTDDHPVYELRQYKIVKGERDRFMRLFDEAFVDSQEAVGMRLYGQFADLDDPDRFVWIRGFDDMAARERTLNDFYFGPVWQARRGEANPLLVDNDNVLLLRDPSGGAVPGRIDIARESRRASPGTASASPGLVALHLCYLWKDPADPEDGFAAFFDRDVVPVLEAAGLSVIAGFVPERSPNNFPRLPVREGEKVFVWMTRAADADDWALRWSACRHSAAWRALEPRWRDAQERPAQILRLRPSARSAL
ncbi:NIPSNAP family protein [Mitsuaria sp. GD03876]|uniref:NIPSNAP family protein n=1 Tax=Mitsuaria sp. GD03876 TaxID=2975399 RepID=UPI00244C3ED2|nr:NIPSNAP family protein [Mitsuaria sp. GD03876]MDH0866344.1 NIPSNAP family protein [Mitsuaria sp. GD03876]